MTAGPPATGPATVRPAASSSVRPDALKAPSVPMPLAAPVRLALPWVAPARFAVRIWPLAATPPVPAVRLSEPGAATMPPTTIVPAVNAVIVPVIVPATWSAPVVTSATDRLPASAPATARAPVSVNVKPSAVKLPIDCTALPPVRLVEPAALPDSSDVVRSPAAVMSPSVAVSVRPL